MMVRKVLAEVPHILLKEDLEKYRNTAIEIGATDAKVVTTDVILIEERVRAKCLVPLCGSVGKSLNCPPHTMDLNMVRKVVAGFQYALFYMLQVPAEDLCGPDFVERKKGAPSAIKSYEICSKIEAAAFYDGYYLAMGFAGGPCGPYMCGNQPCSAIRNEGCRSPFKARPSMEALGINAFAMAANAGWDVYPIGKNINSSEVPHGTKLGLVLIY